MATSKPKRPTKSSGSSMRPKPKPRTAPHGAVASGVTATGKKRPSTPAKRTAGGQSGYQRNMLARATREALDRAPQYPAPSSRGATGSIGKVGKRSYATVVVDDARSESRNSRASAARLTAQAKAAKAIPRRQSAATQRANAQATAIKARQNAAAKRGR